LRKSKISPDELPALVQRWFHNWAVLGWFCQSDGKPAPPRSKKRSLKRKRA
jgi:hypothetical protein